VNTNVIGKKEWWEDRLNKLEKSHSFNLGYKLLCCPWKTIEDATHAFISLNPGAATPVDAQIRCTSEERGNSYFIERYTTRSPITEQYIKLIELLAINPNKVLTGYAHPFRSAAWSDFNSVEKDAGLELGVDFWKMVLDQGRIKTVIITGSDLSKTFVDRMGAHQETQIPSGWNPTSLTKHRTDKNIEIISLPHLSRFKLLSRANCYEPLREIFSI
jgi:hypothetical protein|tara:strand:+ start:1759 stop:2406 length:648 start_codon:yes stop_codon:yes gene_type:complete